MSDQDRSFGEVVERETDEVVEESEDQESEETQEETQEPEVQETQEETQEEPQLTEKGTKLDPNPLSAAHQQLANERRLRAQYEQVLSNPQLLTQWQQQRFQQPQQPEQPKVEEFTPDKLETVEDLAKAFNQIQSGFTQKAQTYEQQIQQLNQQLGQMSQSRAQEQVASRLLGDVNTLKQANEFNSKHPDFVEGLDEEIVGMYESLDFDPNTQTYRGQVSLAQVGQMMLEAARKARKSGSERAQTIVKQKNTGKVVNKPAKTREISDDELSPGDSIAAGISKMFGN
jgi:hypothetical protein